MSQRLSVAMSAAVRRLAVHRVQESPATQPAHASWLLGLRERAVQEANRREATVLCMQAIQAAVRQIPGIVETNLAATTALAAEIGITLAREIVGEALQRGIVDPTPAVRRCLEQATTGLTEGQLVVHLHPEDLALVLNEFERDPSMRELVTSAHFAPNPDVARAAVRLDSGAGRLLYDPTEVLERMATEVRKHAAAGASP